MIILPPYLYEHHAYSQIPQADRWIFNKLETQERLGVECGPTGMKVPRDGLYCVKPITNLFGMGEGGFYRTHIDSRDVRPVSRIANKPGYFWMPWYRGDSAWVQYIEDLPATYTRGPIQRNGVLSLKEQNVSIAPPLPALFQNFSRYMLVEYIITKTGAEVIEAAPRCMGGNARQEIIDDYKTIDPSYDPRDIEFGNNDMQRVSTKDGEGWTWKTASPPNRRRYDLKVWE